MLPYYWKLELKLVEITWGKILIIDYFFGQIWDHKVPL